MPAAALQSKPRDLPGSDRVAAILLSLGNERATSLLKHFDPDEIKRVTRSAADLRPVSAPQLRLLIEDFATEFAIGANLVGNAGEVQRLLTGVLPEEQVDEIMGDINGRVGPSIWERLSSVNEELLANYLAREHPQTVALILSRVKSSCAARVITRLPPDRRDGVFRRMLAVKPVVDDTLRMVESILETEFTVSLARDPDADSHARMAEIINQLDREQMDEVLQSLDVTRPKAAEALRGMMFNFDDILGLSDRARSTIFEKVASDDIVMSLRGTEEELREAILNALGGRVRKMIEQELESGDPVPQRDVRAAQRKVTDLVLQMAGAGEINIKGDSEEEEFVT